MQNQSQAEPQSASPRFHRAEASIGGGVPGLYGPIQHGEAGAQHLVTSSLVHLATYDFRNNGTDSDQLQADRSHLLFGVSIDPALDTFNGLSSPSFGKDKDAVGNNMVAVSLCPSATSGDAGILPNEALDENIMLQRNVGWPAVATAPPVRSFTKVSVQLGFSFVCLNGLVWFLHSILCSSLFSCIWRPYKFLAFSPKYALINLDSKQGLIRLMFTSALMLIWSIVKLWTKFNLFD